MQSWREVGVSESVVKIDRGGLRKMHVNLNAITQCRFELRRFSYGTSTAQASQSNVRTYRNISGRSGCGKFMRDTARGNRREAMPVEPSQGTSR